MGCSESFGANGAAVQLLSSMADLVTLQVTGEAEPLATKITGKGLLACMDQTVLVQAISMAETFATGVTHMAAVPLVTLLMILQVALTAEEEAAYLATEGPLT